MARRHGSHFDRNPDPPFDMPKHARRPLFFRHAVVLLLLCGLLAAAFPLFAEQASTSGGDSSSRPVPLEWFLDETGARTLSAILTPESAQLFEPVPDGGFPNEAGTVWLRFALPPDQTGTPCLDLNERLAGQLPDGVEVWVVRRPSNKATGALPEALDALVSGLYLLPKVSESGTMIYLRVPGVPSPGFAPAIRDRDDISSLGLDGLFWPQIVLGLLLTLCLVRGVTERREWRLLSGLYLVAALVSLVWGVPGTPGGLPDPQSLPGLLAPGVALLLLPHAGRQMMQTQDVMPNLDLALISVGIGGLLLALTPLVPHAEGFVRLLALWPLGMLLCWPIAFAALLRKVPGSRVFALAVLLPPLGFLPLWFDIPGSPDFIKLLPFLTACLSALGLALLPSPRHLPRAVQRRASVPAQPDEGAPSPALVIQDLSAPRAGAPASDPLTERLNALNKELNTLFEHPLQPALRMRVRLLADALTNGMRAASGTAQPTSFSLHEVILEAHNTVSATAERQNLALTWYVAPQLSRQYVGDRTALTRTLTELLASSIRATERGSVQLRAQRLPESNDPGLLMFTIADTGSGTSPDKRDPAALLHAWELAGRLGGSLGLTSGPTGTTVTVVLRLQPAAETAPLPETEQQPELKAALSSALRVLIVSGVPASRQLLAYYLDELPHELREARSTGEALTMYAQAPGALIILDGDLPEDDLVRFIAQLRAFEGEHALPPAAILGLTGTEAQAEQLRRAGCTHTLCRPVQRTELRHMVLRLAPLPRQRNAAPRPRTEKPRPDGRRKLSATSITVDPAAENSEWRLLPEQDVLNKERAASQNDTPQPDAPDAAPAAASAADSAPLRFLQPPTLSVRSNVGEPMPVSKPAGAGNATADTEEDSLPNAALAAGATGSATAEDAPASSARPDGGNVSVPPIRPVRIQAVSRVPAADSSAAKPRSMRAVPYQPGSATSGLSPWTGGSGDWVGDPVPIGTPAATQNAPTTGETAGATPAGSAPAQTPPVQTTAARTTAVQTTAAPLPSAPAPRQSLAGRAAPAADAASPAASLTPGQEDTLPAFAAGTKKKQGFVVRLTGLFSGKKTPPAAENALSQQDVAVHNPSEWVGEPMPLLKADPVLPDAAPLQDGQNGQNCQNSRIADGSGSDGAAPRAAAGADTPDAAFAAPIDLTAPLPAPQPEPQPEPLTLTEPLTLAAPLDEPLTLTEPLPAPQAETADSAASRNAAPLQNGQNGRNCQDSRIADGSGSDGAAGAAPRAAAGADTPDAAFAALIDLTEPLPEPQPEPLILTEPLPTPLPELFPAGNGLTDRIMPLPHEPGPQRRLSGADTGPQPAGDVAGAAPIELTDPVGQSTAPAALPEQFPSGSGAPGAVLTLSAPPDHDHAMPQGTGTLPGGQPTPGAEKTPAGAPLSLGTPQDSGMPSLTLVEPQSSLPRDQEKTDDALELTDRVAPDMPELRLEPVTSTHSTPPAWSPDAAADSADHLPPCGERRSSGSSNPAAPGGSGLSAAPDAPPLAGTPQAADATAGSPDGSAPADTAKANPAGGKDMAACDPADDLDVTALLNTLSALENALREAALRNDLPALRGVSNTMANTADALRMPTLADMARCLAESDDENRESLLEATLEAVHQACQ